MTEATDRRDDWTATREDERRRQLKEALRTTAAERLDWLEEALEIAYGAGALERKPGDR